MRAAVNNVVRQLSSSQADGAPLRYKCRSHLWSEELQDAFLQAYADDETEEFIKSCKNSLCMHCKSICFAFLTSFYSITDTNGMLNRGQMHVFSLKQIKALLSLEHLSEESLLTMHEGKSLLDIGAGDGNVTAVLTQLLGDNSRVTATEVSPPMVARLRERGWTSVQATDLSFLQPAESFDYISLLNVLDRADTPETLLRQIFDHLVPDTGRMILAVVLPWSAFVEVGTQKLDPKECLPMHGGTSIGRHSFEDAVQILYDRVIKPLGFRLHKFTRLPYLCRGDMVRKYYVLYDAVFVLSRPSGVTPSVSKVSVKYGPHNCDQCAREARARAAGEGTSGISSSDDKLKERWSGKSVVSISSTSDRKPLLKKKKF